ncbi:MAG: TadE/TadG family type IV pilus assembly protein [Pseudomonadota bacterium]
MLGKLLRDRRGAFNTLFAVALPTALLMTGAGVDLARTLNSKQTLTRALESAALASASLRNVNDARTLIDEYIVANASHDAYLANTLQLSIDTRNSLNSRLTELTATASVPTFFLGVIGIDEVDITASVSAFEATQDIEISMVLDVSTSMSGGRLSNLKIAATDFVETMLRDDRADYTSINLVPFGGTVNIGRDLFDELATPLGAATVDPSSADYAIGDGVPTGGFRFSDGDYCVEAARADYNNGDVIPLQSRSQLPHFWKYRNFNPWCPEEESAVLLNSNRPGDLRARIQNFTLSDGTGMNIGAMWGYKALSPQWRGRLGGNFPQRPANHGEETIKILVLMTDGGITGQARVLDFNDVRSRNPNEQWILRGGNPNSEVGGNTGSGQFRQICNLAKADNIIVYTVGFQIRRNSNPDKLLAECASDASKYFFVESLDISEAFSSIAASINALRITG